MPEVNCTFPQSGTRGGHGSGILRIPCGKGDFYREWRYENICILSKYRVPYKHFKKIVEKGNVYICERHFKKMDIGLAECIQFTNSAKVSTGVYANVQNFIKTTPNYLYHFGHGKGTRYMWNNHRYIIWNHIIQIVNCNFRRATSPRNRLKVDLNKIRISYSCTDSKTQKER